MKLALTLVAVLYSSLLLAQSNADSLYNAAKIAVQEEKYNLAIGQLEEMLQLRPLEYDGRILLARIYYWKLDYSLAITTLSPVVHRAPSDAETQLLYLNLLLATKQLEQLNEHLAGLPIEIQQQGAFEFCRIQALQLAGKNEEALLAINSYLVLYPDNSQARQLQQLLIRLVANQAILVDIEMNHFNVPIDNWYSLAIGYENRLQPGPLQVRLHLANRFQLTAAQLETDFYPRLNDKTTAYIGFGLSNNTLFSAFRLGGEIYRSLPKAWEISVGVRYLSFKNNPLTTYTLAATKYVGNYYFSIRPFIIPFQSSIYLTSSFSSRRYFSDSRHYLGLSAAIGNSPDMDFRLNDPNIENLNPDLYLLDAIAIRLDYQRPINNRLLLKPFLEYRNEEFRPATYRSRTSLGLSLIRNF